MALADFQTWVEAGKVIPLEVTGIDGRRHRHRIFTRLSGTTDTGRPDLVLVHGFPTCSRDWAPVLPLIQQATGFGRIILLDLLGFGASDKPTRHRYSLEEQTEIVAALMAHHQVRSAVLVGHDYGSSVVLALLHQHRLGHLPVHFAGAVLLNGGIVEALHRARPIQKLLQWPLLGALVARLMTFERFSRSFSAVFAPTRQPDRFELEQHWQAMCYRNGHRLAHRLIHYIADRRRNAAAWEETLAETTVPLRFVWGLLDPVSGGHMIDAVRRIRPLGDYRLLPDVWHYPQLEAPESVAQALLDPFPA